MTFRTLVGALTLGAVLAGSSGVALAQPKTEFKVAWSIYVGWMPWGWAADNGIVAKWADKYGLSIEVTQFNDYVESINQYTAGAYDAVTLTNMDALSIPSAGGVDTTAVIIGDFSAGNDAVILKDKTELAEITGQAVNLVEFSVSHYLLARALESVGLSERDVNVVNTSDPDMVGAFQTPEVTAMVTWNPMVSEIVTLPGATKVFDSSQIPGEIIDMMVANTQVLADNPDFGKALAGIWYETVALMKRQDAQGKAARAAMAKLAGSSPEDFDSQLATTFLYSDPKAAVAATTSPVLMQNMKLVRDFSFTKGLFKGAANADAVGMSFPGGKTLGDPAKVTLRFDENFMKLAADGKL